MKQQDEILGKAAACLARDRGDVRPGNAALDLRHGDLAPGHLLIADDLLKVGIIAGENLTKKRIAINALRTAFQCRGPVAGCIVRSDRGNHVHARTHVGDFGAT